MVRLNPEEELTCSFERKKVEYVDHTGRFKKEGENYTKQFASIYVKRLEELSEILKGKVFAKWGHTVNLIPLSELEEQDGKKCAIIGTLYKHQPNKPSILQELSEEHQMSAPVIKADYCSSEDQVFLEDQTSRIKLTGDKVNIKELVTGVVCAIIGSENAKSTFEVEDWCYPGFLVPTSLSRPPSTGKIVFLSGLELSTTPPNLPLDLFIDWVGGLAGYSDMQEDQASVVRVVIAGNSIKGCADQHTSKGLVSGRAEDAAAAKDLADGTQRLDSFLYTLGQNCCVTFLPGQFDVTTLMMPQQAMHPASFPKAKRLKSVKGVVNPWIGKVSESIIIGTSGQPIQDIQKVCGLDTFSAIEWLEKSLEWRHLCPTAPDTIACMPFYQSDPFIMRMCPDIYFVGNMDKFETKLVEGEKGHKIRLVCIPKFAHTQTAVIVDLENLDATPISFGAE
ncbi:DNA polymerase delta subunit 2-like isoform X2 [Phymastichus coffea]|uniref:DNA polymerase delta subunit 2-like isoform X2 n=1 Tax=Phymastichus coffea TaxID=108790 RepID=UPI00273A9829|nr:DNA polymerase delta subunit 2-like isoform X2 [Phymastichus coffea]